MAESTFSVSRSTEIAAEPAKIYPLISDFHNWTNWSPWEGLDPDLERIYSGPEAGAGAVYEWHGNRQVGKGRMEITGVVENTDVTIKLNFIKPFKAENTTVFSLIPGVGTTTVTWTMTGNKTIATRIMGLFGGIDKLIGKDFEKGLAKLKSAAE